jgi:hypothetical protein
MVLHYGGCENRVLRKILLLGLEEATGDCRLHIFFPWSCIIGIIK